jgi:hypothetical protein
MDEQHAQQAARSRSRAEADQLAAEFESGTVTRAGFASRIASPAALTRYRKQWRQAQGHPSSRSRWVAVELARSGPSPSKSPAASELLVALAGRRIETGCGFDAQTFRASGSDPGAAIT